MGSTLLLDGKAMMSEFELHEQIEQQLAPTYYGRNLDALDEILALAVTPPVRIVWINAARSQHVLGDRFEKFVECFEDARSKHADGEYSFRLTM